MQSHSPDWIASAHAYYMQKKAAEDPLNTPRSASLPIAIITPDPSKHRKPSFIHPAPPRTRSVAGGGVTFDHPIDTNSPPNDDEIIIVTVRITDPFRRASISENADLPSRPQKRGFLRRLSTRVSSPTDTNRYTALKMPRRDYKAHFARDRDGNYVGTEPEEEWTEQRLKERFDRFQDMPLRSVPGGSEFGEGDGVGGASGVERRDSVAVEGEEGRGGGSGRVDADDQEWWNSGSSRGADVDQEQWWDDGRNRVRVDEQQWWNGASGQAQFVRMG